LRAIENAIFKRMRLGISAEEFRNANRVLESLIDALDSAERRAIVENSVDRSDRDC